LDILPDSKVFKLQVKINLELLKYVGEFYLMVELNILLYSKVFEPHVKINLELLKKVYGL